MSQEYNLLDTKPLGLEVGYYHPEKWREIVHEDSPALHVFTDFKERTPETITSNIKIDAALEEMKMTKVKSLLVIDDVTDTLIGLVSSRYLQSFNVGKVAQENGIDPKDLTVEMMMQRADKCMTLQYKDLSNARVGHIARLIHDLGVMHLLVTDTEEDGTNYVRGIFSANRISRQIGEDITSDMHAHSLAEINKRLD